MAANLIGLKVLLLVMRELWLNLDKRCVVHVVCGTILLVNASFYHIRLGNLCIGTKKLNSWNKAYTRDQEGDFAKLWKVKDDFKDEDM